MLTQGGERTRPRKGDGAAAVVARTAQPDTQLLLHVCVAACVCTSSVWGGVWSPHSSLRTV